MKKTKIKTALSIILIVFSIPSFSQIVSFKYDESGNRILREIIYLKSTEVDNNNTESIVYETDIGDTKVIISPNPNGGKFTVKVEGPNNHFPSNIYVHNLMGSLIYERQQAGHTTEVDISNQDSGTYILSLIFDNKKESWKIIKQ
mgnify:CR=1 FL=1